jgi:hypothetical protein
MKNEAWRKWWAILHGNQTPAGKYNPLEEHMWEAWSAAWDACCNQNCNEGRECPQRKSSQFVNSAELIRDQSKSQP